MNVPPLGAHKRHYHGDMHRNKHYSGMTRLLHTPGNRRIGAGLSLSILVAALALSWSGAGVSAEERNPARISVLMATGMPGGTSYQVGLSMASLWTTKLQEEGIRVSAALSEGSRENIQAIRIADADMILAEEYLCSEAFRGTGLYKGQSVPELRSVTGLWPDAVHLLIRSDRVETRTIQDLNGLTLATGLPDSGSRLTTEALVKSLKSPKRKVRLRYLSHMAAVDSLRKGAVQAIELTGGIPIPLAITLFLERKPPLALLEITDAQLEALQTGDQPHVFRIVIPAGTYPGQQRPVRTVAEKTVLAVTSALDPQVVYELTRVLYENLEDLERLHPSCRGISLENALEGLHVPLHRGALRYYRERELEIPERLIP
jgi:uncharacterized protein